MATKELESYNEQKKIEYVDKVTNLNSNVQIIEYIQTKSEKEIDELGKIYNSRKDQVVNFC